MEYERILAVGDIHGRFDRLVSVMKKVSFRPSCDLLVFLGDYIDRGSQPLACMDYVMELQEKYPDSVIALKGNHEALALDYLIGENRNGLIWLDNGGQPSLRELIRLDDAELYKHLDWMRFLPTNFRYRNFLFCHAGVNLSRTLEEQTEDDFLWTRGSKFVYSYDGRFGTLVVGHTLVQKLDFAPVPQFLDNGVILCDTGAFVENGFLSCVDVLHKTVWQSG